MQLNPADAVSTIAAQARASTTVRVLSGNLTGIPLGALLQGVVTQVNPREATLDVNGQALTIRPPIGLQAGAVLFLRVPNTANGTLEITDAPRAAKPAELTVPTGSTQVKVVDVTESLPDGRVRVQIDGQEQIATSREPLTAGSRFVLEVTQSPSGPVLRAPVEGSALPAEVATAILRATPPPDLAAALKPLQAELATLLKAPTLSPVERPAVPTAAAPATPGAAPAPALKSLRAELAALVKAPTLPTPLVRGAAVPVPGDGPIAVPVPASVRDAAVAVRDTIRTIVPSEPRAPNATELRNLVENGGIQFEAKLARLVTEPPPDDVAPREHVANELKGDLKGDLLRLLQTTRDLGLASQIPAARATLDGIESQQATQTLAQTTGTPYILQVPFPDRDGWRTLMLSVEQEQQADREDESRAGRFRMLMHVPLTELGETWIDAGLSGDSFRAAIYLDRADVRDRVRAALPDLQTELRAEGFREVLLDVRATADLPANTKRQSAAMAAGRPASTSILDVRA